MNLHHVLFFCFLSALCGGHSGLVSAKLNIFAGAEGGNGTISCFLLKSGNTKFFCKDECKAGGILIKTDGVRAHSGRYSTRYRDESAERGILSVSITHLIKSDSGRYRCGLGGNFAPDSYADFEVRVLDAGTLDVSSHFSHADVEGENITYGCGNTIYGEEKFLCRNECKKEEDILIETDEDRAQNGRYSIEYIEGSVFGLYVTITRATKSDSGWYRCGYGRASSPDSYYTNMILVIDAATTSNPHWTPRPSTSIPSTSTPTTTTTTPQSVISTSESFTPSSPFPDTAGHSAAVSCPANTGYILPLIIWVLLVVTLLVVALMLLYTWKKKRLFIMNRNMEVPVDFKNLTPASTCEDSTSKASRD